MAMDSSECNGSGEATKVELETKAVGEVGSVKDLTKSDSITSPEREENDGEGIGGPFVFVNGDSDDPCEKDLDLKEKPDLATVGEDKDPSQINAGNKIALKVVKEEVESENAGDPAEGAPSDGNSGAKLGEKIEKESTDNGELSEKKESTDNGELSEKKESTDNGELSEKKESSEEVVLEEIIAESSDKKSRPKGEREGKMVPSEELESELELELGEKEEVGSEVKIETDDVAEPDSGVMPIAAPVVEESAVRLTSKPVDTCEKEEKSEAPVMGDSISHSVENGEKDEETNPSLPEEQKESESVVEESEEQPQELDSSSNVQEQTLEEVEQEVSIPPPKEVMHGEPEGVSDSLQGEKEVEAPETKLAEVPAIDSAVGSEPTKNMEVHKEPEEAPLPLEEPEDMKTPETKSKEVETPVQVLDVEAEMKQEKETQEKSTDLHQDPEVSVISDHREIGDELETSPILVEDKSQESESASVTAEASQEAQGRMGDSETVTDESSPTAVGEIQKPEGDISDSSLASTSPPQTDASKLVESSNEVNPETENESTARDIDLSEKKTEVASHVDESVQIGNFTISIGENGPTALHEEAQVVSEASGAAAPEEPGTSTVEGAKAEAQLSKRIYMIKVPRYSNEEQWARIQEAQSQLDDLTRKRDAVRQVIHKKRIVNKDAWDEVQKAREEERAARAVFNAKRHEISSVQSVINKLNKANSIDDMDDEIDMKEKSLQHETMSLKQEKMLIQEIKELKSKRKQLVDNMGSAAEIDEAFNQRDSIYDKLRTLKTELEVLENTLAKAEGNTKEAQKKYEDTERALCESQDAHKAAHDVREKAYFHWRHLKNELGKKNKHFFSYLDERKEANKYVAPTLDLEGLRSYCNNQVEKVMELWNHDEEFRKQYIESNKISTIRRLRTLDGRALAPDEAPPILPTTSTFYKRTNTPALPTTNQIILEKTSRISSSNSIEKLKDQFPALPQLKSKVSPNKTNDDKSNKTTSSKDPAAVIDREAEMSALESAKMERKRAEEEMERKKREEEAERARREEEIRRKAKDEAEEKERLREEQKAKAKEAEERKKRKAEKAQERAEFKARKEAEIRDKKRAKKDKKKGGGEVDSDETSNGPASDNSNGAEAVQMRETTPPVAPTATKRPTRPAVAMKQLKRVEPVPIALRNRNRRKMRTWLIGIATAVAAILTVFLIGNYLNLSDISSLFWV